ncbi:ABC transporter ATP-binding protein [Lactobacillus helsingborgensis]|uniref:ABC transporter ATP-binding protein n=1 Tax=Lactobacillus helsingborgensis TaxID=1218494 RepID=UPI00164F0F3E|nr:ABC transporter ATP-binding protein [Lactobacillus helsingborgensis]MBC6356716.1 ABC transporter ATP-binding protein [Lactobacillus helsingborgensis]
MIKGKNLKKRFFLKKTTLNNNVIEAVKGINIEIKKGQITGLLGLNGAGKTTSIRMLSGELLPDEGTVFENNSPIEKNLTDFREKVNVISGTERGLFWHLTAYDNLTYFARLYGINKNTYKIRIPNLLKLVGLEKASNQRVETFSKGMKQRLQFARGLINNPDYIFFDEPTIGLDVDIATEMRQVIADLAHNNKKGILLTTHYLKEAAELCDNIYFLRKGEITSKESSAELSTKAKVSEKVLISFNKVVNQDLIKLLKESDGVLDVKKESPLSLSVFGQSNLIKKVIANDRLSDYSVEEMKKEDITLEDFLFTQITK